MLKKLIKVKFGPKGSRSTSIELALVSDQSCPLILKFGRSPKFGGFQEIAQNIAQKFCAIFIFMLRTQSIKI